MALAETERNTRDIILDAVDLLMAENGFRRMTVEDVAREACVARRTVYTYFSSKEALGLASIARSVEASVERLQEIADSDWSTVEKLRQMLTRRVMDRILAVQHYQQGLDELFAAIRPAYMARRKAFFSRERQLLEDVLVAGMKEGIIECENAHLAAQSLLLATNAFLPYSLSTRELGRPEEIEARLGAMVEILLRGVEPRSR